ncbi:MAG: serine protease [archaeon]
MFKRYILPLIAATILSTSALAQEPKKEPIIENQSLEEIVSLPVIATDIITFELTYKNSSTGTEYKTNHIKNKHGELTPIIEENDKVYFVSNHHIFGKSLYDIKAFPKYYFQNKENNTFTLQNVPQDQSKNPITKELRAKLEKDLETELKKNNGQYLYITPNGKNFKVQNKKTEILGMNRYEILRLRNHKIVNEEISVKIQIPNYEPGTDKETGTFETHEVKLKKEHDDPQADFCIISSDQPDLFEPFPYKIGLTTDLEYGDDLMIVSWNSKLNIQHVTKGIVSSVEYPGDFDNSFLFQGSVSHGNSGGLILHDEMYVKGSEIKHNYTLVGLVVAMKETQYTDGDGTTWISHRDINIGVRMEQITAALYLITFMDALDYKEDSYTEDILNPWPNLLLPSL